MKTFRQFFSLVLLALTNTACVAQPITVGPPAPPPPVVVAVQLTPSDRAAIAAKFSGRADAERLWSDYYATNDAERNYRETRAQIWDAMATFTASSTVDRDALAETFHKAAAAEMLWSEYYSTNDSERNFRAWRAEIFTAGAASVGAYRTPAAR